MTSPTTVSSNLEKNKQHLLQRTILFQLSGALGTILFYYADRFIYANNPFAYKRITVSWLVSYALSILWQHALHRNIVFRHSNAPYLKSLLKTYAAYLLSILLSTFVNDMLVNIAQLSHQHAWIATLLLTGIINFFTVSAAFEDDENNSRSSSSSGACQNEDKTQWASEHEKGA